MSIQYPTSLDILTNPNSTDTLASPSHSGQHANINDAVEALELKLGIDNSADVNSIDYQLINLKDKAEALTNKTLTSPIINTGVSGTAILDEDDMVSDSSTKLASQQSIKAYVDGGKFVWRGPWATSTVFAVNDVTEEGGSGSANREGGGGAGGIIIITEYY